jgi:hypothetical protein
MSKHIGRKQRWTQESTTRYSSEQGTVLYQERAWYALLEFKTLSFDDRQTPIWTDQQMELGPYKRPRNAMVALEREVTALRNRHGKNVLIGREVWAET